MRAPSRCGADCVRRRVDKHIDSEKCVELTDLLFAFAIYSAPLNWEKEPKFA